MSQRTDHSKLALVLCILVALSSSQVDSFQHPFPTRQVPSARGISDLNRSPLKFMDWGSSKVIHTSLNLFSNQKSAETRKWSLSSRLLQLKLFMFKILRTFQPKSMKQWMLVATLFLASFFSPPAIARTSGGRIGGTYSRPSRPSSMSRPAAPSRPLRAPLPPRKHYHYPNTYPRYRTSSPIFHAPVGYSTTTIVESPYLREIHPRKMRVGDLVLWTGVGLAVSTGVRRHYEHHHNSRRVDDSPLGPGATAAFLTVALQVSDRNSPSSLLKTLESKAMFADTETRRGLQQVVSEVSLELMRKDSTIVSVGTSIQHFGSVRDAQVAFQKASIMNRSKLDRESVSNVGGSKSIQRDGGGSGDDSFKPLATMAVVTLGLCIEGNSLSSRVPKKLRNRKEVQNALSQIASDVQTEDCLLAAEILWTPEEDNDFLSERDVYADYPDLYPLLD